MCKHTSIPKIVWRHSMTHNMANRFVFWVYYVNRKKLFAPHESVELGDFYDGLLEEQDEDVDNDNLDGENEEGELVLRDSRISLTRAGMS